MTILQKLLESIKMFEDGKLDRDGLLKVQKMYMTKMKTLEKLYDETKSIEKKNKIYKKILRLTDKHILIFD